jgi:hypothetical protein
MTAAARVTAGAGEVLPNPSLGRDARESTMILLQSVCAGSAGSIDAQSLPGQAIRGPFIQLNTSHHNGLALPTVEEFPAKLGSPTPRTQESTGCVGIICLYYEMVSFS